MFVGYCRVGLDACERAERGERRRFDIARRYETAVPDAAASARCAFDVVVDAGVQHRWRIRIGGAHRCVAVVASERTQRSRYE